MSETTAEKNKEFQQDSKNINWNAWLIFGAIFLPMVAAYIVFNTGLGMPNGTINKGTLLQPATPIAALKMQTEDNQWTTLETEKQVWRLVMLGTNDCKEACEELLYLSRQVHIRLGEKARRIERIYLNVASEFDASFSEHLHTEHPRMKQVRISLEDWQKAFAHTNAASFSANGTHLFLVDQSGFAMMTYDGSHQGADMLDDIKRLLKYSYEE